MSESERDAFGNPIDDRSDAAPPASASAVPGSVEAPAAGAGAARFEPATGRAPGDGAAAGGARAAARALAGLFCLLALVATGLMLWQQERDARDAPAVLARELDGHALAERSLVRAANLRRALATVRGRMRPDDVAIGLRLEPTELSVRLRGPTGKSRIVDVDLAGEADATDWGTDTSSTPIDLAAIDPAAPERIVRQALRQSHVDDRHLAYLSLTGSDTRSWYVSLDDVKIADQSWTADLAGVAVTHPGELPFAAGLAGRSLVRAANLRRALAAVGRQGRRVASLRIQPDRLDATVRGPGGARDVTVDAALRVTTRTTPAAPDRTTAIGRLDPAGLERGVRGVLARADAAPARLDYAVLQILPAQIGGTFWTIFLDDRVPAARRAWRASLDGRRMAAL